MKLASVYLLGLVASVAAVPSARTRYVVHERRNTTARSNFSKRDAVPSDERIQVRVALKQRNLDKGMDYLMDV